MKDGRVNASAQVLAKVPGVDIRLYCAELFEDSRQYHVAGIVVAAGDFNFDLTRPSEASIVQKAQFQNAFASVNSATISPGLLSRGRAIDCVLIRGKVMPRDPEVHISVRASDHCPLSLTLQLP